MAASKKYNKGAARCPNPFCRKGQAWTKSYIKESAPEDTWNYRQASFHHAHMIHVRYFDNLICRWTGAWVFSLLGQSSHL